MDFVKCWCYYAKLDIRLTIPDKKFSKSEVIDFNLRSVIATTGEGLTTLGRICSDMNFTPPITENAYNRYIQHVEETV